MYEQMKRRRHKNVICVDKKTTPENDPRKRTTLVVVSKEVTNHTGRVSAVNCHTPQLTNPPNHHQACQRMRTIALVYETLVKCEWLSMITFECLCYVGPYNKMMHISNVKCKNLFLLANA